MGNYIEEFKKRQQAEKIVNRIWLESETTPKPLFFHGTDAGILALSDEERARRLWVCNSVLDYLWTFFEEYISPNGLLNEKFNKSLKLKLNNNEYNSLSLGCSMNQLRLSNSAKYQYGSLYITNSPERAWDYARKAHFYGELGIICEKLYSGAVKLGFDFGNANDEQKTALAEFEALRTCPAQPVVCVLRNLDINKIKFEDGKDCDWQAMLSMLFLPGMQGSYRYNGDYELQKCQFLSLENEASDMEAINKEMEAISKAYNDMKEEILKNTQQI